MGKSKPKWISPARDRVTLRAALKAAQIPPKTLKKMDGTKMWKVLRGFMDANPHLTRAALSDILCHAKIQGSPSTISRHFGDPCIRIVGAKSTFSQEFIDAIAQRHAANVAELTSNYRTVYQKDPPRSSLSDLSRRVRAAMQTLGVQYDRAGSLRKADRRRVTLTSEAVMKTRTMWLNACGYDSEEEYNHEDVLLRLADHRLIFVNIDNFMLSIEEALNQAMVSTHVPGSGKLRRAMRWEGHADKLGVGIVISYNRVVRVVMKVPYVTVPQELLSWLEKRNAAEQDPATRSALRSILFVPNGGVTEEELAELAGLEIVDDKASQSDDEEQGDGVEDGEEMVVEPVEGESVGEGDGSDSEEEEEEEAAVVAPVLFADDLRTISEEEEGRERRDEVDHDALTRAVGIDRKAKGRTGTGKTGPGLTMMDSALLLAETPGAVGSTPSTPVRAFMDGGSDHTGSATPLTDPNWIDAVCSSLFDNQVYYLQHYSSQYFQPLDQLVIAFIKNWIYSRVRSFVDRYSRCPNNMEQILILIEGIAAVPERVVVASWQRSLAVESVADMLAAVSEVESYATALRAANDSPRVVDAVKTMTRLRRKRRFDAMQAVVDSFGDGGSVIDGEVLEVLVDAVTTVVDEAAIPRLVGRTEPRLKRQHAQSLFNEAITRVIMARKDVIDAYVEEQRQARERKAADEVAARQSARDAAKAKAEEVKRLTHEATVKGVCACASRLLTVKQKLIASLQAEVQRLRASASSRGSGELHEGECYACGLKLVAKASEWAQWAGCDDASCIHGPECDHWVCPTCLKELPLSCEAARRAYQSAMDGEQ